MPAENVSSAARARLVPLRRALETTWLDFQRNEVHWSRDVGRWQFYAGFFKGVGLGFDVFGAEFTVTIGCFAFGGVRD